MPRLSNFLQSLLVIVVAAAALRAGYAWNYRATHSRQALGAVPFLFEPGNIAASLADGKGFSSPLRVESGPTAWMTPVYPVLLSAVFRVFGKYSYHAWEAAAALNIAFGVMTCIPLFLIGRRVGGQPMGAAAAWLWAIFPNALIIPAESMWDASLAAFLGAYLLLYTLQLAEARNHRLRLPWAQLHWVAYGLLWGLAFMTSATLALALPFLLGWLILRSRSLAGPALAAGVLALCCAPWTVRNYLTLHAFVPLRSVAGVSLWLGTIDPDLGRWPPSFHPLVNSQERERFLEVGEIPYMREKYLAAEQFIAAHPFTELRLSAHRFAALWAGGAMHPWDAFVHGKSAWLRLVLVFNIVLALAALAGAVLLFQRRNTYCFVLTVMPVVIPFAFYLTLASARYRLLVDPEVMILAAAALARRSLTPAGSGLASPTRTPEASSSRKTSPHARDPFPP